VKKYPRESYVKEVKGMVRVLQERYGLTKREDANEGRGRAAAPLEAEQVSFRW